MPANPSPTTPTEDDAYYRAILNDLIDRGADLARLVHERAIAAAEDSGADPTIAFDRISRAVRRTIALARHIAAGPASAGTSAAHRAAARARLIRGVEDAIHRKAGPHTSTGKDFLSRPDPGGEPGSEAHALHAEFAERLEDPALEFDLEGRPVEEIIQEICQDLGIAMQGRSYIHKRRTPSDIAALRALAAGPPLPALHLVHGGKPPNSHPPAQAAPVTAHPTGPPTRL